MYSGSRAIALSSHLHFTMLEPNACGKEICKL